GSPTCRVRFPYSVFPDVEFLRAQLGARDESAAAQCRESSAPATPSPRAKGSRPLLGGLTDVRTWFTPVTRFGDEVARVVRETPRGAVFTSTLTVDPLEVQRIGAALGDAPEREVFVVFDLNTVLADGPDALELFRDDVAGLHLVPFFNTPRFPKY